MIVEFEDYKAKLQALRPELDTVRAALKLDEARAEIARLEEQTAAEGFWNDLENSQKVLQTTKRLKD